jgi:hypothetical protein
MDKAKKKQLKTKWRESNRMAAFKALPLPVAELKAMFDMLDVALPQSGCDRTRRLTEAWLMSRDHDIRRVFTWLDTQGGYCDCEILANVEARVEDAAKGAQ